MKGFHLSKTLSKDFLIVIFLIFWAALSATLHVSSEELEIVPPKNWYQAEVILFTHNSKTVAEIPPSHFELKFPSNIIRLVDPLSKSLRLEGALLPELKEAFIENVSSFFEFKSLDKTNKTGNIITSIQNTNNSGAKIVPLPLFHQELTRSKTYLPVYENPFELLSANDRNLNDSARVLERRGYSVVLHGAWRFIAEQSNSNPWLFFNIGSTTQGRHEIEGALKFYKSRFLHFEADLWFLEIADEGNQNLLKANLPPLPVFESDEESIPLWRLTTLPLGDPTTDNSSASNLTMDSSPETNFDLLDLIGSDYKIEAHDSRGAENTNELNIQVEVEAAWPIKHSKRIEDGRVYYLDHPIMGMMVLIKTYEPEPLNPPPKPDDSSSEDI